MPQLYDSPWGKLKSPPPKVGSYDRDFGSFYIGGDPRKPASWRDESAHMIVNTIDKALGWKKQHPNVTGAGSYVADFPIVGESSPAGTFRSYLDTIKSNLALDKMLQMKEASKAGATGFGQLSEKELKVLQEYSGRLEPAMSEEILNQNLVQIRQKLTGEAPATEQEVAEPQRKTVGKPSPQEIVDELRRRGIVK